MTVTSLNTTLNDQVDITTNESQTLPPNFLMNMGPPSGLDYSLTRLCLVRTLTWTVGTTFSTSIFEMPGDLIEASVFLKQKLNHFAYFRFGLEFEIRVNSTRFHYGALVASYSPFRSTEVQRIVECSGKPHVIISAGTSAAVTLKVPFIWYTPAIDLSDEQTQYSELRVIELAPLRAVGTDISTSVSVSVFARFVDPEAFVYTTRAQSESSQKNTKVYI